VGSTFASVIALLLEALALGLIKKAADLAIVGLLRRRNGWHGKSAMSLRLPSGRD